VILSLSHHILRVPAALILAAAAFAAARVLKWNLLVIFAVGLAAWITYLTLGGPASI
jgi:hypothetical protein